MKPNACLLALTALAVSLSGAALAESRAGNAPPATPQVVDLVLDCKNFAPIDIYRNARNAPLLLGGRGEGRSRGGQRPLHIPGALSAALSGRAFRPPGAGQRR